jgi:hypothetical protein
MARPRTTVRVKVDRRALTNYLHRSPEMQEALRARALLLKEAADANAAIIRDTGHHYERTYVRKFRGGYQVVNGDTFSFIIEYGSVNNPAYRPLTRAADKVFGTDFHENGKPEESDG